MKIKHPLWILFAIIFFINGALIIGTKSGFAVSFSLPVCALLSLFILIILIVDIARGGGEAKNKVKKIIISIIGTIAVFIISFFSSFFISCAISNCNMSTYGVPLFRPKNK